MSGVPTALGVMAALWIALAAALAVAVGVLWPHVSAWMAPHPARRRAAIVWASLAAPSLLPTLLLAICVAPGVLGAWSGRGDHCEFHPEHVHLCLVHGHWVRSAGDVALVDVVGPGVLGLLGLGLVARGVRIGVVARRHERWLRSRLGPPLAPGVRRVESTAPLALTSGLLRPRIFLSSGLESRLTPADREVVLAHERAHVRRRDPLRFALAAILGLAYPARLQRSMLDALRLATEQLCDEAAARAVGDRLRIAATLVRVERLLQEPGPPDRAFAPGLGGSTIPARVGSLLEPAVPGTAPSPALVLLLVGIAVALAALSADRVHHALEHLLAPLVSRL